MDPSARSPGKSRAGMIQMGKAEAKSVGTTVEELRHMSRAEQLDYIEKYFTNRAKGPIKDAGGLYMLVVAPSRANIPDGQEIYKRGSRKWHQNPKWREGGPSGKITRKGVTAAVNVEKEWVKSVLGTGQNNSAAQQGQGPQTTGGTNPRTPTLDTQIIFNPNPLNATNGTNPK